MSADFGEKEMMTAANDIFEFNHFHALLPLYVSLPDDSPLMDADFWYKLGRCLLHENDLTAAADSFQKAVEGGAEQKDAKGLYEWCKCLLAEEGTERK